jgi:hypothetical protein
MSLILVEQAEVGMVLAGDVTDQKGRLLIPAGRELQERYLEALPMWGVTHVEIEGDGPAGHEEGLESLEPWAVERAEAELAGSFSLVDVTHPFMSDLRRWRVARRARDLQRKGGDHDG